MRHLGEGAQEAVAAGQLEQGFLAALGARHRDQHDLILRRDQQLLQRHAGAGHVLDDAAARPVLIRGPYQHAEGGAGARGLDERAREGAEEALVET